MVEVSRDELARLHVIEGDARRIVERLLKVYRPEYVEKCVREEPDSLLALAKALQADLEGRPGGGVS